MAKHSIIRVIAIVLLSLIFFIVTMVFTALAGPGIGTDGLRHYVVSGIFRKSAYGPVFCSPAVLPHGFFVTWCLNLTLNIAWLFLLMSAALAFLITLTNYLMISFSCIGLNNYGAWLAKYHKVDLWLHRVLVQNAIASLVNLTIVLTADAKISQTNAATISLSVLPVVLLVWW
ncbi:hypothetical protein KUCAC02_009703 [Chaenocephalus aceratus]|nr:hypothetical protein KUCAC02_009703 [Chaenocephalus aceratus]